MRVLFHQLADQLAKFGGVLQGQVCHQQRLRIPDDLSIISCDNTYLSRIGDPMLTSIDIHPGEQGREAIRLLLQMIGGGEVPPETRIASDLVIRGSTGRVPEA